jgi:hypothetical protein
MVFLIAVSLCAGDSRILTGRQYREWTEMAQTSYVAGYVSGYSKATETYNRRVRESLLAQGFINTPGPSRTPEPFCPADLLYTIDFGQGKAILDKYLTDHPERWDKFIGDLAEEALIEACEKRAKNP